MSHHDHGFVPSQTERLNNVLGQSAVPKVQSVQGFVEYQQLRVFHKGTRQQNQSLFATRQLQEPAFCQMTDAKDVEPPAALFVVLLIRHRIQTNGVHESAGHNANGGQVALVGTVHLGRHIADVFLDVPDALARTSWTVEQRDVAGIALRIVCTHQRQQG